MSDFSVIPESTAAHQAVKQDWGELRWVASQAAGNTKNITVGRVLIKKGQCNPRHRHKTCEEVLHLLRGQLRHTIGDKDVVLNPGDTLAVPPGEFHNAYSIGDEDAEMIVCYPTGERDFEPEKA